MKNYLAILNARLMRRRFDVGHDDARAREPLPMKVAAT
jgi:hypothetical protein